MKLKNKLLPIVALSGIATVAMPLVVSCGNNSNTPKCEVEWNDEYEPFLDIFTQIDYNHYWQVKWDFPKAIMSEEINKNIDDYNIRFVDSKTGGLFEYVNQEASYITPNYEDNKYLDLHISCEDLAWMEPEEWLKINWSVTIQIVYKGNVVFSKPIYLGVTGEYIDKWNPNVEKTVSFDPTTGNYSCDSAIVIPSDQTNWANARLFDLESGEIIKYLGEDCPFVLKETVGSDNIYNFIGQWDRLKDTHEPVIISLETICSTTSWSASTWIRVYDITFVPQE